MNLKPLKQKMTTPQFWIFFAIAVLFYYFNEISPYMNKYLVDYAKMVFALFFAALLLKNYLKNFVWKVRTFDDFKNIFSREVNEEVIDKKETTKEEDDSTVFAISLGAIFGIVGLLIIYRAYPEVGSKILKLSVGLITLFNYLLYKNYEEIFEKTKKILNKKLKFVYSVVLFLLFVVVTCLTARYFYTQKSYLGIIMMFSLTKLVYIYVNGLREKIPAGVKMITNILIAGGVGVGLYLLISTFGVDFMQNYFLLLFLYWAVLFAANIDTRYLYGLGIVLIVITPFIHFIYFDLAEYFTVLFFYILLVGVSSDLLKDVVYIEEK